MAASAVPSGLTSDQFTPTDECLLVRLVERQNIHQTITNFTYLSRQFRKVATAKPELLDHQDPRFYTASRCSLAYNRLLKGIAENSANEPGAAAAAESLTNSGIRKSGGSRKGPSVLDLLVNEALPSILKRQEAQLREAIEEKQKALQEVCDLIEDVSKGDCDSIIADLWQKALEKKAAEASEAAAAAAMAPPPPESPARVPSSPSVLTSPSRPDTRQKSRTGTASTTKHEDEADEMKTGTESAALTVKLQGAAGAMSPKNPVRSPVAAASPATGRSRSLRSSASTEQLDVGTPPRSSARLGVATPSTPTSSSTEETPRRRGRPPKRTQRPAEENDPIGQSEDDAAQDDASKQANSARDAQTHSNDNDTNEEEEELEATKRPRTTPRKPPAPATEEQIAGIRRIFRALWNNRDATIFRFPVTKEEAPDYDEMVIQRMDLSTIRDKIGPNYSVIAFYRDFMLMIQNALMYNSIDSEVYQMAITLKRFGKKEFAQILPTVDRSEAPLVLRSQSGPMRLTRSSFQ